MKRLWLIAGLMVVLLLATACNAFEQAAEDAAADAPAAAEEVAETEDMEEASDEMAEGDHGDDMEDTEMTTIEEPADEAEEMMESDDMEESDAMAAEYTAQPWATLELTNARTGETFTMSDFAGKTVYVHSMATWCGNCRASQSSLRDNVVPEVSTDDVVFVSLSVETSISADDLASYANNNSFDWVFAVMTPEMLAALSQQFGRSVTTPPAQPHFIIRPDGATTDLLTGNPSPSSVIDSLQAG